MAKPIQFLLNPYGSAGDVDPFLAIGAELQRRGHRVCVLTNEIFRHAASDLGLEFEAVFTTEELRAVGMDPRIHKIGEAWKIALRQGAIGLMRKTYEAIKRRHQPGQTVIASAIISFGARIAAEHLQIPQATILVDPDKLRGTDHPPVIPPLQLGPGVPKLARRLQYWLADRCVIDPMLSRETNHFRSELGMRPVSRLLHHWWFSPDLVIGLFDEWFAPRSKDWPSNVICVGPTIWDPPADPSVKSQVDAFVDSGSPPIAFIAGSAGPQSLDFFQVALASTRQLNQRGLFLHNNPKMVPDDLPGTLHYARYYSPLNEVLARCAALVHHGGTGTAAHAMWAGIPHLVSPFVFDQPDIAARLKRLGIARIINKTRFTVARLTRELDFLLHDGPTLARCAEISARMRSRKASEQAADLLEQLAKQA